MKKVVDLRTDAVTQPTEPMWEAMREAPLSWAPAQEDPTVNRLQGLAGELTGKEAALFVPTGSMANLVALMVYREGGDQLIAEESTHIMWSEEQGYAALCGLAARCIAGRRGRFEPVELRNTLLDSRFSHWPKTAVVCLENTHNAAGGTILDAEQTGAITAVAHDLGVPVHVDGARIFNAAVARRVSVCELTGPVDSVTLSLCKALSAPAGALLCGSESFIAGASRALRRLGGHSVPQAGILAAAGIVALETMVDRLAEDHRRARVLAEGLAGIPGLSIDLATVQTNIVMVKLDPAIGPSREFAAALEASHVRTHVYSADTLRLVLHRHITDGDLEQVVAAANSAQRSAKGGYHSA